jgi:hypothetical protein
MALSQVWTISSLSAILATVGCGALKRVHECEAVIETVNVGLEGIEVQVPDAGSSSAAYEQIAISYDELTKRIDQLQVEDTALAKALATYREVTERAAKHSRAFGAELAARGKTRNEKKNREAQLNRIRSLAKSDLAREVSAVRKLNALCHPQ